MVAPTATVIVELQPKEQQIISRVPRNRVLGSQGAPQHLAEQLPAAPP
jgi:hypothetical protein